jgi:hypothetical protein
MSISGIEAYMSLKGERGFNNTIQMGIAFGIPPRGVPPARAGGFGA